MEIKSCQASELTHEQLCKVVDQLLMRLRLVIVRETTPDYISIDLIDREVWNEERKVY